MAKRLLMAWAICAGGAAVAGAALAAEAGPAPSLPSASQPGASPAAASPATVNPAAAGAPVAPNSGPAKPRATERSHPRPLDERCRPLKEQLEAALQKPADAHRLFQARLAHNAGNRLCREGHADRGMAEFQRGLSYLQENPASVTHDASSDR